MTPLPFAITADATLNTAGQYSMIEDAKKSTSTDFSELSHMSGMSHFWIEAPPHYLFQFFCFLNNQHPISDISQKRVF
jgi:hypothetical protein